MRPTITSFTALTPATTNSYDVYYMAVFVHRVSWDYSSLDCSASTAGVVIAVGSVEMVPGRVQVHVTASTAGTVSCRISAASVFDNTGNSNLAASAAAVVTYSESRSCWCACLMSQTQTLGLLVFDQTTNIGVTIHTGPRSFPAIRT